jgi:hypothetical protein
MSPDLQLFLSTASVSQEAERYVSDAVVLQDRAKSWENVEIRRF